MDESIHGTVASPLSELSWGRCTLKNSGDTTVFYLHVFQWPEDGKLVVPSLQINSPMVECVLLANGTPLKGTAADDHVQIELGPNAPDPINSAVMLTVKGSYELTSAP